MKRNILLSLVLVLMVGLLCGCGDKEEKTNASKGESNKVQSNETANSNDLLNGVFVAEDDFYLEGLIVVKDSNGYNVLIKDPVGMYTDTVSSDSVKDGKISSNMLTGEYTIEATKNGIVFNSPGLLIEDLKMTKSNGKLDGVYRKGDGYIIVYTLANAELRMTYFDYGKVSKNSTLKIREVKYSDNNKGFTAKDYNGDVEVKVSLNEDFIIEITDKDKKWDSYSGRYAKIY